jgi:hypothetical protein
LKSFFFPVRWIVSGWLILVDADLLREKNTAEWLADKLNRTGCLTIRKSTKSLSPIYFDHLESMIKQIEYFFKKLMEML